MITPSEQQLLRELNNGVDSFESYFEDESADAPIVVPGSVTGAARMSRMGTQLIKAKGNPAFSAQFDISMFLQYYTVVTATGIYTQIAAAGLNAALKNRLPAYVFGQSDFSVGYASLRRSFPLTAWVHGQPFIFGHGFFTDGAPLDAFVTANLALGDLVIPFTSILPGAGTTTVALVVIRCTQVPYGTLLEALSSDRFVMNMIRYVIPDLTTVAQYSNNIGIFKETLFGKIDSDYVSPNSFKKPEQLQTGIIDIPLKKGIDKSIALATYVNYLCIELSWSIFVNAVRKLSA
jgi:hypothetical protein